MFPKIFKKRLKEGRRPTASQRLLSFLLIQESGILPNSLEIPCIKFRCMVTFLHPLTVYP